MTSDQSMRNRRSPRDDFAALFDELSRPVDSRTVTQGFARLTARMASPGFRRSVGASS
jgi:hypothetical protein